MSARFVEPGTRVACSERMVRALDIDPGNVTAGNVMAHAIRVGYATDSDPFAGMEYGWVDEDPDALAFVFGLVSAVEERAEELGPDAILEREDWYEAADAAVPIYTAERWACANRLRTLFDEDEVAGWVDALADIEGRIAANLFHVALTILSALALSWDRAAPKGPA